ncbi:MAG: class I SAM-dependent methyltransferase, partial [Candidatus Methanoperedens sp.]
MKEDDKAGKDFWEMAWQRTPFEIYTGIEKYLAINQKFDKLFKQFLEKGNKKILEIGCAKAKRLIYFAKEFGYEVYGIDYSKHGVEIALDNLKIAGVDGTILCEDLFQTTFDDESFDIVYSMGLVEHFENPAEIIDKHIKLLKKGGILIITIPNFKYSLYFSLLKILGKEKKLLETHNLDVMDTKKLNELLQNGNIKILALDYFGPIDLTLIFSDIKIKMVYLMHILNQFVGYSTFFIPKSRYLSPYI